MWYLKSSDIKVDAVSLFWLLFESDSDGLEFDPRSDSYYFYESGNRDFVLSGFIFVLNIPYEHDT